jgi:hypothetical protein
VVNPQRKPRSRAEALFELTDAASCTDGSVRTLEC